MVDKLEYKIIDIKPLSDGKRFQVIITSEFNKDIFGDEKPEYFTFPLRDLQNDRWKKIIDKIMLRRAAEEEEKETAGLTNIQKIKEEIKKAKQKHTKNKVDLTSKYNEIKSILMKPKEEK